MSAGLVYREEDILLASKKGVNPGLGPHGSNEYNLFLYKGGVNCYHFWQRKIYLRKGGDEISVNDARKMVIALDPSKRNDARIEPNDKDVAKRPIDMPNHGALPK